MDLKEKLWEDIRDESKKVRVNINFSEWERVTKGWLQESIFGPSMFTIFLTTFLFLFQTPPWVTMLTTIQVKILVIIWTILRIINFNIECHWFLELHIGRATFKIKLFYSIIIIWKIAMKKKLLDL